MKSKAIFAFIFYAFLYFSLIYYPGLVRMDDFGYLQGVIETLVKGRIQTHAWLEPYSATVTSLSALAFLATGNFPMSTWGLQSLFVLLNALLIYRLLRFKCESGSAALIALAIVTLPFYLHKASEFGGTVTTMTAVLVALWAYLRGRWGWFFLAAFFAFANRQNNIALLVLPTFHILFAFKGGDSTLNSIEALPKVQTWKWVLGTILFLIAAALLHSQMNQTIAQQFGIYAGIDAIKVLAIFRTQIFGLIAGMAFLSAFGFLMGENPQRNFRANLEKPGVPFALTLLLWLLPILGTLPLISFLTPLLGSLDRSFFLQNVLLVLIPILIWTLNYPVIRFDAPFCLFIAYTCLSGLRGYWYDFYLMDVGFAAFFYRLTRQSNSPLPPFAKWVALAILAVNGVWAYTYKIFSDKQMLSVQVYEALERAEKVPVDRMTDATFGYLGWKLFDHYWQHEPITYLANFLCYGRRDRVVMESELPWRRRFKSGEVSGALVESGVVSIGFFPLRYRFVDKQSQENIPFCESHPLILDSITYAPKLYPLTPKEWSEWIEARRKEGRKGE